MSVRTKIKENPTVSSITGFLLLVGLLMGSLKAIDDIDGLVMTEVEAAEAHDAIDDRIDVLRTGFTTEAKLSKCRWLSDKIDRIRYEIYVLQKDDASPDFIQSKARELSNVERDFGALGCAAVLA